MCEFIERLKKCGYEESRAYEVCCAFAKNLSYVDLLFFVQSVERNVAMV